MAIMHFIADMNPAGAPSHGAHQADGPTFTRLDLGSALVPYERGLSLQRAAAQRAREGVDRGTVLMLEHEAVYTAGRRSEKHEHPTDGTPVVEVDRGGKVTWHGPGQLVVYPIIRLADGVGGVTLVRALEEALIEAVGDFGVRAYRIDGRTGVWTNPVALSQHGAQPAKIAQIGIRVSSRVVTHGIALNCSNSLDSFNNFVPCGISDAGVTSLSELVGREITPTEAAPTVEARIAPVLKELTV